MNSGNPPNDDTGYYSISFKPQSLALQTPRDRLECDAYVRDFEGRILKDPREGNPEPVRRVGSVSFSIIKVSMALEDGANLFDFFDSEGWLYELGETLINWETREIKEEITEVMDEPFQLNLLAIHGIEIHPRFRGKRLGLEILRCVMEEHADSCGLAALNVYPHQFVDGLSEKDRRKMDLSRFSRDPEEALSKLRKYFQQLGFVPIHRTPYMIFNLDYKIGVMKGHTS